MVLTQFEAVHHAKIKEILAKQGKSSAKLVPELKEVKE